MTKSDWLDLTVLERQKYNHLSELMDLTRQLGEAIDRGDEVSVRILVSMRNDPLVGLEELKKAMEPARYVGRAPQQVEEFLDGVIRPILEENRKDLGMTAEITV